MYPTNLADDFVVCYFEYRGTGLSYHSDSIADDMTTERYLSDIIEITDYLRNRFKKEKIYILGHSFGTYAALMTVQKYPERYYAYIAMFQICNQKESEYLAYDYMKQQYEKMGNQKMVKQFEAYPIRDSKDFFTFENSAHSPLFEEPEKARDCLQIIVDRNCPS